MDSQKRTGKRSGEVVENKYLWKKQTGTNRKTKLPISLKILESEKTSPEPSWENIRSDVARPTR